MRTVDIQYKASVSIRRLSWHLKRRHLHAFAVDRLKDEGDWEEVVIRIVNNRFARCIGSIVDPFQVSLANPMMAELSPEGHRRSGLEINSGLVETDARGGMYSHPQEDLSGKNFSHDVKFSPGDVASYWYSCEGGLAAAF